MKAQRWGEGDFPSQRKRLGANQVSEGSATKTPLTPLTSTASPRGTGRGLQGPPFVTETNPASPCRTQASFVPSHQVSKSSSESPTLPSQSCILSSRQRHIFSWLFLSFYPRTTQQFHQGLRGYRSIHSLRGPNHIYPDPGHNSCFPAADLFLVELFKLQLTLEKQLIKHITWVAPGLLILSNESMIRLHHEVEMGEVSFPHCRLLHPFVF